MTQQDIISGSPKVFSIDYYIDQKLSIWELLYGVTEYCANYMIMDISGVKYPMVGFPTSRFTKEQITRLIQTGAFSYENYEKHVRSRIDFLISCGDCATTEEAIEKVNVESFWKMTIFYTMFGREVVEATKWFSKVINLDVDVKEFQGFNGLKRYCFYQLMKAIKYNDDFMIEEFYKEFKM